MAIAFRTALRTVSLTEPWLLSLPLVTEKCPFNAQFITSYKRTSKQSPNCSCKTKIRRFSAKCSDGNDTPSSSSDDSEQGPPQEAILKAISEVSKTEGRVGQTTNMIIGGTVTDDSTNEWLTLDKKVNSYPTVRGFTAIGTGGEDFVQAMVVAVESVLQLQIPKGQVRQNISSGGKYVSVKIGPVQVFSSEQVQAVYNAMRRDDRMKYFL